VLNKGFPLCSNERNLGLRCRHFCAWPGNEDRQESQCSLCGVARHEVFGRKTNTDAFGQIGSVLIGPSFILTNDLTAGERQNEIYSEAAIRTERCDPAVRRRRVGERRRWLAVPKQGRLGIARYKIRLASYGARFPFRSRTVGSLF
jgi:hypothetical protein